MYTDGQAIALRLSRQLNSIVRNMKLLLASYNDIKDICSASAPPTEVTWDDVAQLDGPIWSCVSVDQSQVDLHAKYRDRAHVLLRCQEELQLISEEKQRVWDYYCSQHKSLIAAVDNACESHVQAVLFVKGVLLEYEMEHYCLLWKNEFTFTSAFKCKLHLYYKHFDNNEVHEELFTDSGSDCDSEEDD